MIALLIFIVLMLLAASLYATGFILERRRMKQFTEYANSLAQEARRKSEFPSVR